MVNNRLVLAIAGPATLLAAVFLVPHEADADVSTVSAAEAQLAIVAGHQPATYIGFLCIALALALVGCFGWQLGRLPTGRGRTTARIGGGMVFVGGVAAGLANLVLGVLQTSAAQPGIDRAAAANQLLATESGWILAPFFMPYLIGLVAGSVVLTVGLLITGTLGTSPSGAAEHRCCRPGGGHCGVFGPATRPCGRWVPVRERRRPSPGASPDG